MTRPYAEVLSEMLHEAGGLGSAALARMAGCTHMTILNAASETHDIGATKLLSLVEALAARGDDRLLQAILPEGYVAVRAGGAVRAA